MLASICSASGPLVTPKNPAILAAGELGLPRPQEELPGVVVEHDVRQWRPGQPAVLADPGELGMEAVGRESGAA